MLGHGVEANGRFFCCAHCAKGSGFDAVTERAR
jgi:hypothetical protein